MPLPRFPPAISWWDFGVLGRFPVSWRWSTWMINPWYLYSALPPRVSVSVQLGEDVVPFLSHFLLERECSHFCISIGTSTPCIRVLDPSQIFDGFDYPLFPVYSGSALSQEATFTQAHYPDREGTMLVEPIHSGHDY